MGTFKYLLYTCFFAFCYCGITQVSKSHHVKVLTNFTFRYPNNENPVVYCMYFCVDCRTRNIRVFRNKTLIAEFINEHIDVVKNYAKINTNVNIFKLYTNNYVMMNYQEFDSRKYLALELYNNVSNYDIFNCLFSVDATITSPVTYLSTMDHNARFYIHCKTTESKVYSMGILLNGTMLCDNSMPLPNPDLRVISYYYNKTDFLCGFNNEHHVAPCSVQCLAKSRQYFTSTVYINVTTVEDFIPVHVENNTANMSCFSPPESILPIGYLYYNDTVIAGFNGTQSYMIDDYSNSTINVLSSTNRSINFLVTKHNVSNGLYDCIFPRITKTFVIQP